LSIITCTCRFAGNFCTGCGVLNLHGLYVLDGMTKSLKVLY
jgi:hypothetical protein